MNGYKQILESFCIITNKMWTRSSTLLYEKSVACGKFITQFYGMHGDCKRDFAFTYHVFQRYRKIASLKSKGLDKCFFALKIMILGDAIILGAYHSFKWPLPNSEEYAMNNRLPIKIQ